MDMWLVFILPPNPRLASSVTKNVTERTVCRDVRPMFMLIYLYLGSLCWKIESSSTRSPRLPRSADEECHSEDSLHGHVADVHTAAYTILTRSVTRVSRTVCRDKWSMFMISVKIMQKQNYARKVLPPCQCQLRIRNLNTT